ncbi:MAG: hypothetical protein M1826_002487 [Phylliscum demangeonii]|nr:MAG: hypothetical protein M1826_002487 [Phylliscum demangeonii]
MPRPSPLPKHGSGYRPDLRHQLQQWRRQRPNKLPPPPLLSPLASPDASDGIELDAGPGPLSVDDADVFHGAEPPPPLSPSTLPDDGHASDDIELGTELGPARKRAKRAS